MLGKLFLKTCLINIFIISGCTKVQEVASTYENGRPRVVTVHRKSFFGGRQKAVERIEYYYNHNLKFKVPLKEGAYQGTAKTWWLKGRLKAKGKYIRGRKEGQWRYFFEKSDKIASKGLYRWDKREGPWVEYWSNGQKRRSGEYAAGEKTGLWLIWDRAGRLLGKNSCFEGDTGTFIAYHPHGALHKKYACRQGKPVGPYRELTPEGDLLEEGAYDSLSRKQGIWRSWHANKASASLFLYFDGLLHGPARTWDSLGNPASEGIFDLGTGTLRRFSPDGKVTAEEPCLNGLKHGEHKTYYPSGQHSSSTFYNNDTAWTFTRWHKKSAWWGPSVAVAGSFRNGKRHGTWVWLSEGGVLLEEAAYVDGKRHGPTRYYDRETGKLHRTQMYRMDVETMAVLSGN